MFGKDLTIYQRHGHRDRNSYMEYLAKHYNVPLHDVMVVAKLFGEDKDFTDLIEELNDWSEINE